jgi:hypothetical protein
MSIESLHRNRMGMSYKIVQEYGERDTKIICETLNKSIVVREVSEGDIRRGWYHWMHGGKLAQEAFPFLSHEEREFLISGITPAEWHEIFDNKDTK